MTSEIIPRPYCAAAPDSWMSWSIRTVVPLPFAIRIAVTVIAAWPRPLRSAPDASMSIRFVASSRSTIVALPANSSLTGPIRIATPPAYAPSPRSSVRSAPGRHAATPGMSPKNSQTFSIGWATSNSLLISI